MSELADKFRGALLGMAIGDALGMPADGMTPYEVIRSFQSLDGFFRRPDQGMDAGQYTSNAQMALVLAKAMSLPAGMDGAPEQYLSMKSPKELSPGVRKSLDRLRAGLGKQSPACGASADFLPRVVPVGLWAAATKAGAGSMLRACRDAAQPTHSDKKAIISSYAVARIVMESASRSKDINSPYRLYEAGDSLLSRIASVVRDAEARLPPGEAPDDLFWMRLRDVMSMLSAHKSPLEAAAMFGTGGSTRDVVPVALFCFLRAPDDYKSCMEAANLGGLASIRASLVGGMVGAFAGEGAFPMGLRNAVENSSRITALAEALDAKYGE